MKYILETKRLKLRELDLIDTKDFYDLNSNPNVIKYTGDAAFNSINEAKQFLENYQDYKLNGYGRWAVIVKETNQFIGWCGLKLNSHETDIGFRFFEEEWDKGYATESAIACLDYGFEDLKIRRIIGRAMKNNVRSIRILEKIGLQYERDIEFDGCDGVVYKIEK
ncbi:GNAT family N-acetyltransferase [Dysgonomonas capnocytophagoides]|uniref:GNAT family N-acetyltransferase n=1 Tax=Dysgonomonas capnocytophagoides TaxID=45254 RepID=UPI002922582A|nr:GNAT family N-acetyltransferase [Dysgonomonas capnocytophagoides]